MISYSVASLGCGISYGKNSDADSRQDPRLGSELFLRISYHEYLRSYLAEALSSSTVSPHLHRQILSGLLLDYRIDPPYFRPWKCHRMRGAMLSHGESVEPNASWVL